MSLLARYARARRRWRDRVLEEELRAADLPRLMELLAIVGAMLLLRGASHASELVTLAAAAAASELLALKK